MGEEKIDYRQELEYDYKKYIDYYNRDDIEKKWKEEGIFHRRLTFESGKIFYVTTARIKTDYSFGNGDFIISYWDEPWEVKNKRWVIELSKMEIGDENGHGELILCGDFNPNYDDLINVRYKSIYGKEEFKSAKNIIENKVDNEQKSNLINIDSFFRLKFELADIGEQSKALYDLNNSIIDGAAGTGKSTIAIQKLKYLSINKNISEKDMIIVVKNSNIKNYFKTLLQDKEIALNDVEVYTVEDTFNILDIDISLIDINLLKLAKNNALYLREKINQFINKLHDVNTLKIHFNFLIKYIGEDKLVSSIQQSIEEIYKKIDALKKEIEEIKKSIQSDRNTLTRVLKKYRWSSYKKELLIHKTHRNSLIESIIKNFRLKKDKIDNIEKEILRKEEEIKNIRKIITNIENAKYNIPLEVLKNTTHNNEFFETLYLIRQYIYYYERIDNENNSNEYLIKLNNLKTKKSKNIIKTLKKIYFREDFILEKIKEFDQIEQDFIIKYLLDIEKPFDTIIIDEAQDYTLVELEVLRLQAKKIILTGDILQNIEDSEIKDWEDLLFAYEIYGIEDEHGEEKLNIFTLKHNFRQTYQLANASFNFRQLLLNRELEDIASEYYRSEKEFNGKQYPPVTITYYQDVEDIKRYIEEKIDYIQNTFVKKIPIVLICKNNREKQYYEKYLSSFRISYDADHADNVDIILVHILDSKGKQFPIVISSLDNLTDKEIYLIMTRGQFMVEFLSNKKEINNTFLETLYKKKWIDIINIKFNQEKIIEEDNVLSKIQKQAKSSLKQEESSLNKKNIEDKESSPTIKEQILKHQAETFQYDEDMDPDIIIDEDEYHKSFIEKLQKDINSFNSSPKKEIAKQLIIVNKKNINKNRKVFEKIKMFLYKEYKGHCQICSFTFRKVADGKNSFEVFNWNDKRVVKKKKSFITTADSLCLCRNCSANIKWGAFEPVFMNKIENIKKFKNENIENIKKILCSTYNKNIVDKFKNAYEWETIYALEITLNNEPKNIYFSNEHLIQFVTYLKLEL